MVHEQITSIFEVARFSLVESIQWVTASRAVFVFCSNIEFLQLHSGPFETRHKIDD